jgi:hypothetical protein
LVKVYVFNVIINLVKPKKLGIVSILMNYISVMVCVKNAIYWINKFGSVSIKIVLIKKMDFVKNVLINSVKSMPLNVSTLKKLITEKVYAKNVLFN